MDKKYIYILIAVVIGVIGLVAMIGNNQSGSTSDFNLGAGATIGTLDNSTENQNETNVESVVNTNDSILQNITNMSDDEKQDTILRKTLENNDEITKIKLLYSDEAVLTDDEIKK